LSLRIVILLSTLATNETTFYIYRVAVGARQLQLVAGYAFGAELKRNYPVGEYAARNTRRRLLNKGWQGIHEGEFEANSVACGVGRQRATVGVRERTKGMP
jgi:hypothetical protein